MHPYYESRIIRMALVVFFIIVLIYAYIEARGILYGPSISIDSSVQATSTQYVLVQGHVDRIDSLLANGSAIEVTENGDFSEPYVLSLGLNRIVFDAKDKYGHTTQSVVQIVYAPSSTSGAPASNTATNAASTTQAATSSQAQ